MNYSQTLDGNDLNIKVDGLIDNAYMMLRLNGKRIVSMKGGTYQKISDDVYVLEINDKVINENKLTALMITHNMSDAIKHGNRLIMMNEGKIVYDVSGEEKKNLTVEDLMKKFSEVGGHFSDRAILG